MAVSSNTILGKYRIIREIARSNDIVYEAIDPTMARRVAVKELQLPPHLAGAQKRERIERFYREAKAAGTLSHRNIVTIHDVGQENDRHFLVMEYLEGQSLRDILQMQGALPLKETVEITLQLCDALAYAHSRGVVHRDVKPDNVHILPGGVIKLTDFGIARITAEPSITSQGQVFGTPSYMSPEQVASHTVDHRTDLFSMGITLYEMLTGRKPFQGDSVITITYNIMNVQPTMPVGVPAALQQILQRALAKDPNLRYQNAAAMAADLRAEKFALTASPSSPSAPLARPTPLTFAAGASGTLDTGTVPAEISGIPASLPTPGQPGSGPLPSAQSLPGYTPPPADSGFAQTQALPAAAFPVPPPTYAASSSTSSSSAAVTPPPFMVEAPAAAVQEAVRPARRLPPAAEKFVSLALPIVGVVALLALLLWGIRTVVVSLQSHNRRVESGQFIRQATDALRRGNYAEANKDYAQAQAIAPAGSDEAKSALEGQSQAYTALGLNAAHANDLSGAQAAYQKAVDLNSRNAAAWDNLGNIRWQAGDTPRALDAWDKAVQADPTSVSGTEARQNAVRHYMDLAQSAAGSGGVAQAREYWQKVTEIDPGSDEAFKAQQALSRTTNSGTQPAGVGLPR